MFARVTQPRPQQYFVRTLLSLLLQLASVHSAVQQSQLVRFSSRAGAPINSSRSVLLNQHPRIDTVQVHTVAESAVC